MNKYFTVGILALAFLVVLGGHWRILQKLSPDDRNFQIGDESDQYLDVPKASKVVQRVLARSSVDRQKQADLENEQYIFLKRNGDKVVFSSSFFDHPRSQFWASELLGKDPERKRRSLELLETAAALATHGSSAESSLPDDLDLAGYGYLNEESAVISRLMWSSYLAFTMGADEASLRLKPNMLASGKAYAWDPVNSNPYPGDSSAQQVVCAIIDELPSSGNQERLLSLLNLLTFNLHVNENVDWWVERYEFLESGPIDK